MLQSNALQHSMWDSLIPDSELVKALHRNNYSAPTQIQAASLAQSIGKKQDVIIAAQTGSGKTLCFAIPLILHVVKNNTPQALVLAPTRELALQIKEHIDAINYKSLGVACLIGGMALPKQQRIVRKTHPEIIIATPGRLWEFINDLQDEFIMNICSIQFLVIDEADRMVEMGHFMELGKILNYIYDPSIISRLQKDQDSGEVVNLNFGYELALDPNIFYIKGESNSDLFREIEPPEISETGNPFETSQSRQTFLVSATLTMLEEGRLTAKQKKKLKKRGITDDRLQSLMQKIQFNGEPVTIDVTTESKLPSQIQHLKITCKEGEKDGFLYYYLRTHEYKKGIIFTNSISCTRKILSLLKALNFNCVRMDGRMKQRERLNKLDKFRVGNGSLLVATEVAGRGIDLPLVDLVIHYQFPLTVEQFVHRCGRTGRMNKAGISLALINPKEIPTLVKVQRFLASEIPTLKVDMNRYQKELRAVLLASELADQEFQKRKLDRTEAWKAKNSEAAGIQHVSKRTSKPVKQVHQLKSQINQLAQDAEKISRGSVITPEMFAEARRKNLI